MKKIKVSFISLGCAKNTVDSEKLVNSVRSAGYYIETDPEKSHAVIINTCGFIKPALDETYSVVNEISELKTRKKSLKLIVIGCAVSRNKEIFQQQFQVIDALFSLSEAKAIIPWLNSSFKNFESGALDERPWNREVSITLPHYAYLKIAEGCNRFCSFCTIPSIRGKYRSFPVEELVNEATSLASRGVKELIIIAQDITSYGKDLYGSPALITLLKELSAVKDIKWIRLMYTYPENFDEVLLEYILHSDKILKYIDLPIQHSHNYILQKMGRGLTAGVYDKVFRYLRKKDSSFCLRTTVITGFPGETKTHHEHLKEYIGDMKFDRLGVFKYNNEQGTNAFSLNCQNSPAEIEARYNELMLLQQDIHFNKNRNLKGTEISAIIDRKTGKTEYTGRTFRDAPEIDSNIFIRSRAVLKEGDIISVEITGVKDYDLCGKYSEKNMTKKG